MSETRRRFFEPEPIVFLCIALYALALVPGLGWRDAPEFTVTAATLGVAHPSGYPVYSLLARAAAFLPLGSIAFRLSLFSALAACGGLVVAYLLCVGLARWAVPAASPGFSQAAAALATLALGLSPSFFSAATQAEVYTLNAFFMGLVLLLAFAWLARGRDHLLLAASFVYGLSAGNHGSVALYLPGFFIFFLAASPGRRLGNTLFCALFFLLGFSAYLYLPLRSLANPTIDWGDPETWARFLHHITDRKDADAHFAAVRGGAQFFTVVRIFLAETTPWWAWPLVLPLASWGLSRVWRRSRALAFCMGYLALVNILFFITWRDTVAFLPALLTVMVCWGLGFMSLGLGLSRRSFFTGRASALAWGLVILIGLGLFAGLTFSRRDRSNAFIAQEAFLADYENLPPEAISLDSLTWFHERAFQDVLGLRPDVTVMNLSDFVSPQAFHPVTPQRFPRVAVPEGGYDKAGGQDFLKKFLAANLSRRRLIYWEPNSLNETFYPNLKPTFIYKFAFNQTPYPGGLPSTYAREAFHRVREELARLADSGELNQDPQLEPYLARILTQTAAYFRFQHRPQDAVALLDTLEEIFGPAGAGTMSPPELNLLDNVAGAAFLDMRRIEAAALRFERIVSRDPYYYDGWANLGLARLRQGFIPQAIEALERAVELDPDYPTALFSLGQCRQRLGQAGEARRLYRAALKTAVQASLRREILEKMAELSGGAR